MWSWLTLFLFGFICSSLFALWFFNSRKDYYRSKIKGLEQKNSQIQTELNKVTEKNKSLEKKSVVLIAENAEYLDKIATFETQSNNKSQSVKDSSELSSIFEKSKEIKDSNEDSYDEVADFNNRVMVDDFQTDINAFLDTDFDDVAAALSINADDSLLIEGENTSSDIEVDAQKTTLSNAKAQTVTTPYYSQYQKQKNKSENGLEDPITEKATEKSTEKDDSNVNADINEDIGNHAEEAQKNSTTSKVDETSSELKPEEQNTTDETSVKQVVEFDKNAAKTALGKTIKLDDLKVVEGIGPKIAELFNQAGITTWQKLADTSVDECKEILKDAGSRFTMHKPETWPEQSGLAADGKWQELAELQKQLKGGRRG